MISVIIPTLDEEAALGPCLEALRGVEDTLEVIVADGGSRDRTREVAARFPEVTWVSSPAGRARQMNAGARVARGEVLWFLHADSRPPVDAGSQIFEALAAPEVVAGAFRFAIASRRPVFRLLEWGVRVRSEWFETPYGDQGLFLAATTFFDLGGYPEVPTMEDLYLVRALRRVGRVRVVTRALPTSARSWETHGVLWTTWVHWTAVLRDWLGLGPPARRFA